MLYFRIIPVFWYSVPILPDPYWCAVPYGTELEGPGQRPKLPDAVSGSCKLTKKKSNSFTLLCLNVFQLRFTILGKNKANKKQKNRLNLFRKYLQYCLSLTCFFKIYIEFQNFQKIFLLPAVSLCFYNVLFIYV